MKYSNLGRTGLKVSRIGLGTMNFGMETSEARWAAASSEVRCPGGEAPEAYAW